MLGEKDNTHILRTIVFVRKLFGHAIAFMRGFAHREAGAVRHRLIPFHFKVDTNGE